MAKKKKKKKQSQKQQTVPKQINYDKINSDEITMTPFNIYDRNEYDKNEIAESILSPLFKEIYTKGDDIATKAKFDETKHNIVTYLTESAKLYPNRLGSDDLNIYDENSKIIKNADIIDFTQSEKTDILKSTMQNLASLDIDSSDLSYLWATNEYVHIIVSPSLEYAVKRAGYDNENKSIDYEIACFEHRQFDDNNYKISMPSIIAKISVSMKTENEQLEETDEKTKKHNANTRDWIVCQKLMHDINSGKNLVYKYPVYRIKEIAFGASFITFAKKIINNNIVDEKMKKAVNKMVAYTVEDLYMPKICYEDDVDKPVPIVEYICQKLSVAIACIVSTNMLLKTEKLSAPQKAETKSIKYIVNTNVTDDEPIRKTRNLGKIKISSYKRPVQPSMKRIIKYSKQSGRGKVI